MYCGLYSCGVPDPAGCARLTMKVARSARRSRPPPLGNGHGALRLSSSGVGLVAIAVDQAQDRRPRRAADRRQRQPHQWPQAQLARQGAGWIALSFPGVGSQPAIGPPDRRHHPVLTQFFTTRQSPGAERSGRTFRLVPRLRCGSRPGNSRLCGRCTARGGRAANKPAEAEPRHERTAVHRLRHCKKS
jgi:hypothetical protein